VEYKIGDFAQKLGVSQDLLKHYEELGIISSRKRGTGSYRYYDFRQAPSILTCKEYQGLGFPLKQIGSLLKSGSGLDYASALRERGQEFDEETLRRDYARRRIEELLAIAESVARGDFAGRWSIREAPAIFFLPHSEGLTFSNAASATGEALRDIGAWLCAARQAALIDVREDSPPELRYGIAIATADAERLRLSSASTSEPIPSRMCLEYFDSLPVGLDDTDGFLQKVLERPLAFLREHRFEPAGTILVTTYLRTVERGTDYIHRGFLVPIDCGVSAIGRPVSPS